MSQDSSGKSEPPRQLIINADDLGMSASINDAIFALMDAGLVTSTTALANSDAIDAAVLRSKAYPQCSFGVHLNITFGKPMRPADELSELVDETGNLTSRIFAASISPGLRRAIGEEWCAQVESLQSKGLKISHFDSHEHVHTIPALFAAFKTVQRRFGIRRARLTKNIYCREMPAGPKTLLMKKAAWNNALRFFYKTRTTRLFGDLYSLNRAAREGSLGAGAIEAMVHPGATTDPIMTTELSELRGGSLDSLPFTVRLISYNDL